MGFATEQSFKLRANSQSGLILAAIAARRKTEIHPCSQSGDFS
jgi:hypothetical protein